ncbi:MAG: U32 family peptidase [Clostridia bacterium]|nr:U32 family peptidase [Clostridia bacterium]
MEILAPAGNFDCLKAAIFGGADAVYVGGSRFSARKSAANFDDEELKRAVDFCHIYGAKIYVAINILIKETEIKDALSFLEYVRQIGADGVIIQDLGLLLSASKSFPDLKINASTQMTVHNASGAQKVKELGAKRVVLSREVSFDEIKEIRKKTDIELEVFTHGALCMSYSGQCLMSSIIGARSGNRGACAQPCRLTYKLLEEGKEVTKAMPLLSPKDLCLIKRLSDLEKSGVASLKIEGRMKSPEYVGLVSRVYSDALKYGYNEAETEKMLAAFSRGGSSEGFFYGKTFKNMMDYSGGAKIDKEILADISLPDKNAVKKPIDMHFYACPDEEISLLAQTENEKAFAKGEIAEVAEKVSLDTERAAAQLKKLGDTPFYADKITCEIKDGTAVPIKAINELRRNAVEILENKICKKYEREYKKAEFFANEKTVHTGGELCCECMTAEQAQIAKKMGIDMVYVPISEKGKIKNPDDFIFVLPAVIKDGEEPDLSGINKICAQNIGQLKTRDKEIYAGHRLNVFNSGAVKSLEDMGVKKVVLSPELNLKEIEKLAPYAKNTPDVIAYGRLPLMYMENCIIKSAYKCACKGKNFAIKDRMGEIFPVACENCRNIILNSKVIFMADRVKEIASIGADLRLLFTIEDEKETQETILKYQKALMGEKIDKPERSFTRGHLARGVI